MLKEWVSKHMVIGVGHSPLVFISLSLSLPHKHAHTHTHKPSFLLSRPSTLPETVSLETS